MTNNYIEASQMLEEFIKFCDEKNVPVEIIISQTLSKDYFNKFIKYWSFNNQTPETD